jgi:phage tail-like protein|tara:strand:- start:32 stop:487 length:456 start_codon:yes stop_codon:yes gene_type:complete
MPTTTAGPTTDEQLIGSWFSVELDNGIKGKFTDVGGLGVDVEVVEHTSSDSDTSTIKRPGSTKYAEITLKRALSPDKKFWDWAKKIRDGGTDFRTNGAVVVFDMTSGTETGRWTFTNAWPSKWSASDLDVGSDDVMSEEVTLQIEHIQRDK